MKRFRSNKMFGVLILVLFLYGCLPSLHPLYTVDTIIFDEALLGKWYTEGSNWSFIKDGQDKYMLRVWEDEPAGAWFEVHLVQVGDHRFIDLYPGDKIDIENTPGMYNINLVPAHTFMKLDLSEPNLLLRWVSLDKVIKQSPETLRHERYASNSILITAKPEEIQRVLIENLDTVVEDDGGIFRKCPVDFSNVETYFDQNLLGQWDSGGKEYLDIVPAENRYDILYSDCRGQQAYQGVLYNLKGRPVLGIYALSEDTKKNDLHMKLSPDMLLLVECSKDQMKVIGLQWDQVEDFMNDNSTYSFENSEPDSVFLRITE